MLPANNNIEKIEKQFVDLASTLSQYFPDLDLRFNLQDGSTNLRCLVPEYSEEALELCLGDTETEELLYEAIFSIKALARLYDD